MSRPRADPEAVLVEHELAGDGYQGTGRFTDEVVLDRPVALRFRLDTLLS